MMPKKNGAVIDVGNEDRHGAGAARNQGTGVAIWDVIELARNSFDVLPKGLARQLGCTWKTLWRSVRPVLEAADDDEDRFVGVTRLGSTSMSGITPRPSPSTRAGGTRKSSPAWSI